MKFVWKDDVVSSVTDELYTVRDDENNIVYRGIVPEYDLFYLNRVAQKLMKRGTLDFTSGVTQHPDMSIDLTLFDTQDVPVKSEVYINAFKGEYRPDLSNPINGKLDPRMMFLWTAYNERTTQYVINGEQPAPPAFHLNLSGATSFTYNQQTSVIAADCSDWDAVDIVRTGSWFYIIKTRNGLTLSIDRNTTDSARTGTLDFYYSGSVYTSMTLSQQAEAAPSSFVLEFSGSTYFNFIPDIHMLYVTDCTDWNGVTIGQEGDWFIPTKTTDGVALDVDTNFEDNARTGALKFYYNGILVKTVNLTQGVYSFTIEMSGNTVFDYQQQTGELAVVQCTDWANTDLQQIGDWFVATKTNTGITIQLQENETGVQRNGSIQLYYDSGEYGLVYEATITQNKFTFSLEISGQTSFDYTAQQSVLSAVCNDWSGVTIEKTGEWFNYTKTQSGITLDISKNSNNEIKMGFLTLSYESEVVSSITLSQEAFVLELEISGNTSFDYTQQTSVLSAVCNDWSGVTMETSGNWFSATKTESGITLSINQNTTQEMRYGFLTLTYNSQVVRMITLSQTAAAGFVLELSGQTMFDYVSQVSYLSVVQCSDWSGVTVLKSGDWFSSTKTNTGVTLNITENPDVDFRYGYLTFVYNSQPVKIVSLTQNINEVAISDYFTIEALGSGTITLKTTSTAHTNIMEYKKNNDDWVSGNTYSGISISVVDTDKIRWRNTVEGKSVDENHFGGTAYHNVSGNIMSLAFGDNYKYYDSLSGTSALGGSVYFRNLFYNDQKLHSAENLLLPAKTLDNGGWAYGGMFGGCISMFYPPKKLPATLGKINYEQMFYNCTSLRQAPIMAPVNNAYYQQMFYGCTSLEVGPDLTAQIAGNYAYMFYGCSHLKSIKCLIENPDRYSNVGLFLGNVAANGTFYKKSGVSWPSDQYGNGIPSSWTVISV